MLDQIPIIPIFEESPVIPANVEYHRRVHLILIIWTEKWVLTTSAVINFSSVAAGRELDENYGRCCSKIYDLVYVNKFSGNSGIN